MASPNETMLNQALETARSYQSKVTAGVAAASLLLGSGVALARSYEGPIAHTDQSDTDYGAIPAAMPLLKQAQQEAISEHQGMNFVGPNDEELGVSIQGAAYLASYDPIRKIRISRIKHSNNKLKVRLTQENQRGWIPIAVFQDPQDLGGNFLKEVDASVDGDVFDDKNVSITPLVRSKRNAQKFSQIGKKTIFPSWDNLELGKLIRTVESGADPADPTHTESIIIKTGKNISKLIKSGRFYLDVNQECVVRDTSYNPSGQSCKTILGTSYKVLPKKKPIVYVAGRRTKTGNVIIHSRLKP